MHLIKQIEFSLPGGCFGRFIITGALTAEETEELQRLKVVINQGSKAFVEVGNALLESRDQRLYRGSVRHV